VAAGRGGFPLRQQRWRGIAGGLRASDSRLYRWRWFAVHARGRGGGSVAHLHGDPEGLGRPRSASGVSELRRRWLGTEGGRPPHKGSCRGVEAPVITAAAPLLHRPTVAEIDLSAVRHNVRLVRERV